MRYFKAFMTIAVGVGLLCNFYAAADEKYASETDMKRKLEYSKQILDGLVTEDFDKILKGSKALNELAQQKWLKSDSSQYDTHNHLFWFTAGALVRAAKQQDIDSATLSYTQLTLSCVNCHKLLRAR